ncbi:methionine ABC transporter ATP-binding protein [Cetobacterium sp. SF1]|uniref:methionine ABC transporter ATP-binding protein n=1 Tax=unclassified Cetobacterium TaxID=2630983 RepID=UPI003CFA879F
MIRLENVKKIYKTVKGEEIEALKELSYEFNRGEITGIIGYSGAGKSTLLRCLNLLEEPSEGDVFIDNVSLRNLSSGELREKRKKIGMIFQHFNLMKSRTVGKNIEYPLKGSGLSKKEMDERVNELLDLVNLRDKKNVYPSQLSGGQKQRVGIARALANNPDILLCDEATSALDPETTISILELLKEVNEKLGVTIILITHQMEVIKEICHRVVIMEDGEVKEEGDVIEVFSRPKEPITKKFLSSIFKDEKTREYLKRLNLKANEKIVKISYVGHSTEEAYISKISKNYDLEASILYGAIEIIRDTPVGNLIVKLNGKEEKIAEALEYLERCGIYKEVLDYVR